MPTESSWQWHTLLYIGTVLLRRSERAFWRMTPRKFNALTRAHIKLNSSSDDKANAPAKNGYIDQVL